MSDNFTVAATAAFRQEIRKSRFAAIAGHVAHEDEARRFIEQHADRSANHNCWAFRIGQAYRFNDDGEPAGTAGKPILQSIDGQRFDRVVVLVTRWFGGTLLGSGGLIRAYGGTAAACLREAEKVPIIERVQLAVACDFSDLGRLRARLDSFPGAQIIDQQFTASGVLLRLRAQKAQLSALQIAAADATQGRAEWS